MFYKSKEKELESRAWELYLVDYSSMDSKSYKPFALSDYIQKPSEDAKKEELVKDAESFISKLNKKWGVWIATVWTIWKC